MKKNKVKNMKKNTAYFIAVLACIGITIIWLLIFSLDLGVFWQNLFTSAFIILTVTTWRAITKKPKRESREEAVKNVDYNKEVLIRIDEEIEEAQKLKGKNINYNLISFFEHQCTSKEAALDLIEKYSQAFNKDLLKRIINISNDVLTYKNYLIPFINAGIIEAEYLSVDQGILKSVEGKSSPELIEILRKHDVSEYKEETFDVIKFILDKRNIGNS